MNKTDIILLREQRSNLKARIDAITYALTSVRAAKACKKEPAHVAAARAKVKTWDAQQAECAAHVRKQTTAELTALKNRLLFASTTELLAVVERLEREVARG